MTNFKLMLNYSEYSEWRWDGQRITKSTKMLTISGNCYHAIRNEAIVGFNISLFFFMYERALAGAIDLF